MSALRQFAAGPPTLLSATCSLHPQDDVVRCRKKVMGVDDDADEVSLGTSWVAASDVCSPGRCRTLVKTGCWMTPATATSHTRTASFSVVKVEILRWGDCTCTLGPLSVHVGPLLTVVPPPPRWSLNRRVGLFIHLLKRLDYSFLICGPFCDNFPGTRIK